MSAALRKIASVYSVSRTPSGSATPCAVWFFFRATIIFASPIREYRIAEAIGRNMRDDCRSFCARLLPHIAAQKGRPLAALLEVPAAYTGMIAMISQASGGYGRE